MAKNNNTMTKVVRPRPKHIYSPSKRRTFSPLELRHSNAQRAVAQRTTIKIWNGVERPQAPRGFLADHALRTYKHNGQVRYF